MMMRTVAFRALLLLCSLQRALSAIGGCTSVIISAGATVDGHAMTSQTADSLNADFRVVYVPAQDHPEGAKRALPRGDGNSMMYPRNTDTKRSPQYIHVENPVHPSEISGYIPQVRHTYALWEGLYGLMNEHGLSLGESTTCGNQVGYGIHNGGTALFTIGNLMSVALERCRTAICAVQTMGDLAEEYGFYGEDPGIDGAGEAVTVADPEGDAWVVHFSGGVVNRTGSLWVAQRVPDGHVAVVANSFVIKEVDLTDNQNFRGSKNLLEDVKAAGLWDGKGKFNWQASLAPDYNPKFEASENQYDALRQWRVFSFAAPSIKLHPSNRLADFPFSVPADKKVSYVDLRNWLRDQYQDTEFDMRLGALAGPGGSPRRFGAQYGEGAKAPVGQYARSIAVSWSVYSFVCQPGAKHPVLWYAADSAASSVFVPFYTEALKEGGNGRFAVGRYGSGSMLSFDLGNLAKEPAWWAFNIVDNWMQLAHKNMSLQYVYPKMYELQDRVDKAAQAAEKLADEVRSESGASQASSGILADKAAHIQNMVAKEWWELASMLMLRYNDQSFNFAPNDPTGTPGVGVPAYWLEMMGFNKYSMYPSWMQSSKSLPTKLEGPELSLAKKGLADWEVLMAVDAKAPSTVFAAVTAPGASGSFATLCTICVAAVIGSLLGHGIGYRRGLAATDALGAHLLA